MKLEMKKARALSGVPANTKTQSMYGPPKKRNSLTAGLYKMFMREKKHAEKSGKEPAFDILPRFDSKLPPNAKMPDVKYPNAGNGSVDENTVRIVTRNYDAKNEDELSLRVGTRVIVLNARSSPAGYHDGMVGGQRGFFPKDCVEEVQLRRPLPDTGQRTTSENFNDRHASIGKGKNSVKKQHASADAALTQRNTMPDSISLVSFESSEDMQNGSTGRSSSVRSEDLAHYQATSTPGVYHNTRGVALWKGNDGFGFILRGAKSEGPVHEFNPSARYPGLQYLESVEDGSNAHNAGLRSGDFIIRIGETDVRKYGHQQLVDTIRACGEPLQLLVTTVIHTNPNGDAASAHSNQLDNVLAMEDIEQAERTASVRRIPGRKVGCEQLQSLFRQNGTAEAIATLPRQPQQSTFSSAKKPIRVLPPQLNSSNTFQYEHVDTRQQDDETRSLRSMSSSSSNSSSFTTWGRSSGPPPPGKDFRAHSVSGATGERLLAQSGAKTRKMPPPPPKRINSRLSVSIPEEEPVRSPPTYTSATMTVKATQQTTSHQPPAPATNTQSDMAAAIALAARNRAERVSRSEEHKKQEPEPNPPSPPQGPVIEETPTKSVAEISSALSLALAAKQRSLDLKAGGKTVEPKRPASFKINPAVKTIHPVQRMAEERQVLPPPPSNFPPPPSYDDVSGLELPPPPSFPAPDPHHTQYNHMTFDELMLPPPPTELLPSPTLDSSNTKDIKAKRTTLGFLPPPPIPPPDEDDGCTSPNGADNLSNADSGVADVAGDGLNLSHGHRLSHDHVSSDNHSTVSSLSTTSTMSSEDQNSDFSTPFGERAWPLREVRHVEENVAKSSPPTNNQAGNMYLDVLKKAKTKQQPPVPNTPNSAADSKKNNLRPGITVTKMTFAPISSIPPPQSEESDKPKTANAFPPAPKEYSNVETKPLFPKGEIQTQKVSFGLKAPVQKPAEKPPVKTTPVIAPAPAKTPQNPAHNEPLTKPPPNGDGDVTKKPLAQWSVGDVSEWLKELGLQMYISSFEENEISGEHLPDLGKDELIELGVKPFGHRLTIDRSIKKLIGA